MNRSYRAPEKEMPVAVKQRQRQQLNGSFRNLALREKEEELGLFLEMKKREKERHDLLLHNAEAEFDSSLGSRTGNSPIFSTRKTGADEFLNSENDKNDYDWLLTPPGTPLFPSSEVDSQKTVMNQNDGPKAHPSTLKSRLSNTQPEANSRNNLASRPRPSSSGGSVSGSGSRPSSPTGRPALGTQSRTMSNPVSKNKHRSTSAIRPSRSSTPTSRSTLPSSSKPTVPARSSTPTSRSTARSSTPTSRSTARSSTPTSRPSLSTTQTALRALTPPRRPATSSTVAKTSASLARSHSSVVNSGSSPKARPIPWKPHEMPGYTLDAPPNLRTSLTDRPISSIRGRAGAPSSRSSSIEPAPNGRVRRQSCSPSRGRLPNGINRKSGASVPVSALNRAYAKANDTVSPGSYGTKMVERVINMRKLMPPRQNEKHSPNSNLSGKSSSPDSSGFGSSFSKKSLDMAMRHMDIRRTVPSNLRPLMTKIPASSMYSVRSGPTRNRMISVSDSPLATSSNASSEMSVNNNNQLDENIDDESNSEKGVHSPARIRGRQNALRIEEKEKMEKELLNLIIDDADECKINFHNNGKTICDDNTLTNRESEKAYLAGRDKFHAEADKSYWKAIADLIPKEVPSIETRGSKKDQDKEPSVVVIQGPKPGKPTDLSRMRQIIVKLKNSTPIHLKHSPQPPAVKADAFPSAEAVAVA